jgi:3-oxoacyl-[acyl-carrier-protein] synthase III
MALKTLIESMGVYLPGERLSTYELIEGCTVKPAVDLEEFTGIKSRPMVGDNEYSFDLAVKAVSRCLEISRYGVEDIEMVICANICRLDGPKFKVSFEPSTGAKLAAHFNFKNAITFDISNACTGMFTGVQLVDSLLKSGLIKNGLVVSGEYITHLARNAQKEFSNPIDSQLASLTLGDSGAAIILEETDDPDLGFHEIGLFTVAELCKFCIGTLSEKDHGGYVMYTDSARMHKVVKPIAGEYMGRLFQNSGWKPGEDHYFINHQVADKSIITAWEAINHWLGGEFCQRENVIINVENRGNTSTTTHFIALWDYIKNGTIESGSNIFFGIQGSGFTFGVATYTLDDLPRRIMAVEPASQ